MGSTANVVQGREGAVSNIGWQTPAAVFDALNAEFGPFHLDPAGAHTAYVSTQVELYSTEEATFRMTDAGPVLTHYLHGLEILWRGKVFVNPPYKRVEEWVRRGSESAKAGALVVMLLMPSTDAKWFHRYVWDKRLHRPRGGVELRFLEGRIRFVHPDPTKRETDFKGFRPISGNMLVIFHPAEAAS